MRGLMPSVIEHCYEVGLRMYHTNSRDVAPWIMIQSYA